MSAIRFCFLYPLYRVLNTRDGVLRVTGRNSRQYHL
jgi:hypothetical protein